MSWQSLSFITSASNAEKLCDALIQAGALSASIEDADAGTENEIPQFGEPGSVTTPGWERSRIVALLEKNANPEALISKAYQTCDLGSPPSFTLETIAEQNWVQLTQSQFEPIQISERLWIVPSWHDVPDPNAINLTLDPGMAFGTGSHPTTRLCLKWLEQHVFENASVLDYGCGSGILAIAACRFGATKVFGVDIDPQAIETARVNAEKNCVQAVFSDSSKLFTGEYDLVVANILANPLRVLAPAICSHVRSGGRLALSGILREQAEEIIAIYSPWLNLSIFAQAEDWVCLAGEKP